MKKEIKDYFENLDSKKLGLKDKINVNSVSKLGMGTSNLNYLVRINKKKFIFRMNMETKNKNKSRKEFEALKIIESHGISPKPWILDESRKDFDSDFIIISYIEGKTSNKMPEYMKPKMFRKIGDLCGKLHSVKIKGDLKRLNPDSLNKGYTQYVSFLKKEYMKYLNLKLKNKEFLNIINESYNNFKTSISVKNYKPEKVLSQGDFCEQNIVVHKGEYKLIDFEDLEISDRASHLAKIFSDFGKPFNEKQKKLFLDEYFKIVKANRDELVEKIGTWIPLKIFAVFLWSIHHILKVKNKEMHFAFLEKNDIKKDIAYAKTMFKRGLEFGVIDKKYRDFDIRKILK